MWWVFDNSVNLGGGRWNCSIRQWLPKRWRIYVFWISLFLIIMAFVILAATLFPRQIPCDTFPASISSVVSISTVTNNTNSTIPLVCFAANATLRPFEVIQIVGSCMDLSEMVQASVFIQGVAGPPLWNWAGSYAVPNATIYRHKCDDLNLYLRPHSYICKLIKIVLPNQLPTVNTVEGDLLTLQNPIPCNGFRWNFLVPVIYESWLKMRVSSISPTGFCINTQQNNITISGIDFLYYESVNPQGIVIGTGLPTIVWNNLLLNVNISYNSCTEIVVNQAVVRLYNCTALIATIPQVPAISDDTLYVVNAEPCIGSTTSIPNATLGVIC